METEEWKPVVGFPQYLVSNWGRVQGPRRLLKGQYTDDGYVKVTLCVKGTRTHRFVHRLVLEAFDGPCPDGMETRHKDGVSDNNRLDNLKWGTQPKNYNDRRKHSTCNNGQRGGRAKLTWEQVDKIREEYVPGKRGFGIKSLAKKYEVAANTIQNIFNGGWDESLR